MAALLMERRAQAPRQPCSRVLQRRSATPDCGTTGALRNDPQAGCRHADPSAEEFNEADPAQPRPVPGRTPGLRRTKIIDQAHRRDSVRGAAGARGRRLLAQDQLRL
jgi:hypothetical protein